MFALKFLKFIFFLALLALLTQHMLFNYITLEWNVRILLEADSEYNMSEICPNLALKYDNDLALLYTTWNKNWIDSFYQVCENNSVPNPVDEIKMVELNSNSDGMYMVKLAVSKPINCSIQELNKQLNVSERRFNLTDPKIQFVSLSNYSMEIKLDKPGFYYVECTNWTNNSDIVYAEVVAYLPTNMTVMAELTRKSRELRNEYIARKIDEHERPTPTNPMLSDSTYESCDNLSDDQTKFQKMNVLIIVIDSVSLAQFRRAFPQTYEYVTQQLEDNILFENVGVNGENTYPNMLPLLAGVVKEPNWELNMYDETSHYKSLEQNTTFHDLYPFVWKRYESIGYLTSFLEDSPTFSTFNFVKDGFRYHPTSVYYRQYWHQMREFEYRYDQWFCYLQTPTYKRFFNLVDDFVEKMNSNTSQNLPYFALNFLNEYTHEYLAIPPKYDQFLKDKIKKFEDQGYLNNTLFILMSDHGLRMTDYPMTYNGYVERGNPFVSFRMPKALRNTEYYHNAKQNTRKIISHFDLYKTLQHFYYINKYPEQMIEKMASSKAKKCRDYFRNSQPQVRSQRGVSVMEKMNYDRTCTDALIPTGYCNCKQLIDIKNETEYTLQTGLNFNETTKFVMTKLNEITDDPRDKCEAFRLDKVDSIMRMIRMNEKDLAYKISFRCQPGDAVFQANLKLAGHKSLQLIGKLIRLSKYGNQSACMTEHKYYGYCYCKTKLV